MCKWGDEVSVRVTVPADLSSTGQEKVRDFGIDRCIAPIVAALEAAGIKMRGSCCGHGKCSGEIVLADGRTLAIASPGKISSGTGPAPQPPSDPMAHLSKVLDSCCSHCGGLHADYQCPQLRGPWWHVMVDLGNTAAGYDVCLHPSAAGYPHVIAHCTDAVEAARISGLLNREACTDIPERGGARPSPLAPELSTISPVSSSLVTEGSPLTRAVRRLIDEGEIVYPSRRDGFQISACYVCGGESKEDGSSVRHSGDCVFAALERAAGSPLETRTDP